MLGFRYIKSSPSTHLIETRGGRVRRQGNGLAFFYFAPSTSLVSIPLAHQDAPFAFREVSQDFQEVSVQGQATFRVLNPETLAQRMDFTLAADGVSYASEDPLKLSNRLLNAVQVQLRSLLQASSLQALLTQGDRIEAAVRERLRGAESLSELGVGLVDIAILAIKPTPETGRALEAEVREQILKRADDATYSRRNSAIEQERAIKQNELETEIAVEAKKRQIREAQLDAERAVLEKRQQIEAQEMAGRISLEDANIALVDLRLGNTRKEAEAKADAVRGLMAAVAGVEPRVLQALTMSGAEPSTLIALAFQGLAENASRIGELNISPDLLQSLTRAGQSSANKTKG